MKSAMLPAHIAVIVDDDKDVNLILSATLKLKNLKYIRPTVQKNA